MRTVTAYKTKDGRVFATEAEAGRHEGELEVRELLECVGRGGEWNDTMTANHVLEHASEMHAALGKFLGIK